MNTLVRLICFMVFLANSFSVMCQYIMHDTVYQSSNTLIFVTSCRPGPYAMFEILHNGYLTQLEYVRINASHGVYEGSGLSTIKYYQPASIDTTIDVEWSAPMKMYAFADETISTILTAKDHIGAQGDAVQYMLPQDPNTKYRSYYAREYSTNEYYEEYCPPEEDTIMSEYVTAFKDQEFYLRKSGQTLFPISKNMVNTLIVNNNNHDNLCFNYGLWKIYGESFASEKEYTTKEIPATEYFNGMKRAKRGVLTDLLSYSYLCNDSTVMLVFSHDSNLEFYFKVNLTEKGALVETVAHKDRYKVVAHKFDKSGNLSRLTFEDKKSLKEYEYSKTDGSLVKIIRYFKNRRRRNTVETEYKTRVYESDITGQTLEMIKQYDI